MFLLINQYLVDEAGLAEVHPAHTRVVRRAVPQRPGRDGGSSATVGRWCGHDRRRDPSRRPRPFAAGDPYTGAGVVNYTVIEFNLARCFPDRLPEIKG
jgi:hypothetical protein